MDIYVLDEEFKDLDVLDTYDSMIWTERYSEFGDFEIVLSGSKARRLNRWTALGIRESKRVMIVETIDEPGDGTIKYTGRSLESLMDSRVNLPANIASGAKSTPVTKNDTPQNIAKFFFESVCRTNTLIPADNLSFVAAGDLFANGNIPRPTDSVAYQYSEESLYSAIKAVCDPFNLGFVLGRNHGSPTCRFQVYTGSDRTGWQTTYPAVILSTELDTLEDPQMITSAANYRNVAYVFAENGSRIVYADGSDDSTAGFDRRVMFVSATDITLPAGAELNAALNLKGKQALAEQRFVTAFDGKIPDYNPYVYGVDYNLGDYVERRDTRGFASKMLVTEQIFVSDANGDRSYPTLQTLDLVTPGSWRAWSRTGVWNNATGSWSTV